MKEIKAVLFDFGGVFTVSPFSAFDAMGESLGAKPGQINEIMFGAYANATAADGDHPWHALERGEITLEAARQAILELAQREHGLALDIYQLFAGIPRDAGLRRALVDRVAALKREGYATAIITNNIREFADGWRALLPVDELFDVVVDSCIEGVRKPDTRIFEIALQRLGNVAAEQTIFLDDYPANVEAARQLGMQAILVDDNIDAAIANLDRLLARR